jgi:hypothetical protein
MNGRCLRPRRGAAVWIDYAEGNDCRTATLLRYFGDRPRKWTRDARARSTRRCPPVQRAPSWSAIADLSCEGPS